MRAGVTALLGTAAIALAVPAAAPAAPKVLDRVEAEDGTTFTVSVGKRLRAGRGVFRMFSDPPAGTPYALRDELSRATVRRATERQDIQVGSSLVCEAPAASAVYGTAERWVRRVVVVFDDGRKLRVRTERAPRRWRWKGRVFAGIRTAPQAVTQVRAFDRRGKRLAVARFTGGNGCD